MLTTGLMLFEIHIGMEVSLEGTRGHYLGISQFLVEFYQLKSCMMLPHARVFQKETSTLGTHMTRSHMTKQGCKKIGTAVPMILRKV